MLLPQKGTWTSPYQASNLQAKQSYHHTSPGPSSDIDALYLLQEFNLCPNCIHTHPNRISMILQYLRLHPLHSNFLYLVVHITILFHCSISLCSCLFIPQCFFFPAPCLKARVTRRLCCWFCCDIFVFFVDKARQDVIANIMIQPPSLGDICPDRNVVIIVNTSYVRILLLPKLDDERMLHLLKLSGAAWQI
jgi:hypothetical protein